MKKDTETNNIESCLVISLSGIGCKKVNIPCQTFKEASELSQKYIQINDLGGSTFKGGVILHPVKGEIAHVSYNGRVWEGRNVFSLDKKEITNLNTKDL